jgi:hypothetical protein
MMLYAAPLLTADECAMLRRAYDDNIEKSEDDDYSGWPVLRLRHFVAEVREVVGKCVGEAVRAAFSMQEYRLGVSGEYMPAAAALYPETIILTAMGSGGHHIAHADNVRRDVDGRWIPNHTPHRTHTAMVYLSRKGRDFSGGELCFPEAGVTVVQREGMMVVFPSDGDHVHEVLRVGEGSGRYALSIWLTDLVGHQEAL